MTRDLSRLLTAATGLLALAVDAERYADISDVGDMFAVIHRGDHPGVRVFLHDSLWVAVDQTDEKMIACDESVTNLLSRPRVVLAIRAILDAEYEWVPDVDTAEALLELAEAQEAYAAAPSPRIAAPLSVVPMTTLVH